MNTTTTTTPKDIAQSILEFRLSKDLSQARFALCLGISRQTLVAWETGASIPSTGKLRDVIAEAPRDWARVFAADLLKVYNAVEETNNE